MDAVKEEMRFGNATEDLKDGVRLERVINNGNLRKNKTHQELLV